MELKVDKLELLRGLNFAIRAAKKSAMPISRCILLHAEDNRLTVTGNNLTFSIEVSDIDAMVYQSGRIALDAGLFSKIINKMPNDDIQIKTKEKYITIIKCGKINFEMSGCAPEEFPKSPVIEHGDKVSINREALKSMLERTNFAVSKAEDMSVYAGELIELDRGTINVIATNRHLIAHRYIEIGEGLQPFKVIVPGRSLEETIGILSKIKSDEVNIYHTERYVIFEIESFKVISRILDGDYINCLKFFEHDPKTLVTVNKEKLLSSLERAILINLEKGKRHHITLDIQESRIKLTATASINAVQEEIEAEIDGEGLTIRFDPYLLIDVVRAIEDEKITLQFSGKLSPCIIQSIGEGNYQYLISPLNLPK